MTVALIDSGFMKMKSTGDWKYQLPDGSLIAENSGRCIIYRDFLERSAANDNLPISGKYNSTDQHGHGTHVAASIADRRQAELSYTGEKGAIGIAPDVNLMIARALDRDGQGSYAGVIAAIEWVVANRARFNVRILNLSLYAPVSGPYWSDPINQAVMKGWRRARLGRRHHQRELARRGVALGWWGTSLGWQHAKRRSADGRGIRGDI